MMSRQDRLGSTSHKTWRVKGHHPSHPSIPPELQNTTKCDKHCDMQRNSSENHRAREETRSRLMSQHGRWSRGSDPSVDESPNPERRSDPFESPREETGDENRVRWPGAKPTDDRSMFVGQVPKTIGSSYLEQICRTHMPGHKLPYCAVQIAEGTGQHMGCGKITWLSRASRDEALKQLDDLKVGNNRLRVHAWSRRSRQQRLTERQRRPGQCKTSTTLKSQNCKQTETA